jgi:hypothetical protein
MFWGISAGNVNASFIGAQGGRRPAYQARCATAVTLVEVEVLAVDLPASLFGHEGVKNSSALRAAYTSRPERSPSPSRSTTQAWRRGPHPEPQVRRDWRVALCLPNIRHRCCTVLRRSGDALGADGGLYFRVAL